MQQDSKKKIPAVTLYFNTAKQASKEGNQKEYLANIEAMQWLLQRYRYPSLTDKERSLYMGTVLCSLPDLPTEESKEWVTPSKLRQKTGISLDEQKELRETGKLPFHNWGGKSIRYRLDDIKEFFKKGRF